MSERTVRIPTEALAQRLNRLEERVRALSLRSWPGSVRTAREPLVNVVEEAPPVGWRTLVSITVDPGRWVVFAETRIAVGPLVSTGYNIQAFIWATDPATGAYLSGPAEGTPWEVVGPSPENFHFTRRIAYLNGQNAAASVHVPLSMTGDFASEEAVTITLGATSVDSDGFDAYDSNLLLLPV